MTLPPHDLELMPEISDDLPGTAAMIAVVRAAPGHVIELPVGGQRPRRTHTKQT